MPGDRVVPTAPGPWWASRRGCVLRVRYVEALITGRPGEYAYYDCATCLPVEDEQFAWLAPVTPHGEVERLRALLDEARDIVSAYAPGHTVWLDAADEVLRG